jgi:maltose O-acetyltransferase
LVKFVLSMIVRDVFVNAIAGSYLLPSKLRRLIYKIYGMTIRGAYISPKCYFGGKQVFLGDDTYLNYGCWFDTSASIVIGDNCAIGLGVKFITSTHDIGGSEKRAGRLYGLPIVVGDGCWFGSNVTVLPGVTIGNGCIIAAGAVVTKDCQPNGMYAGVPARRVKELHIIDHTSLKTAT